MSEEAIEAALDGLEGLFERGDEAEALVALAYGAARNVDFDEDDLAAATRRALFVLAAGGDPHRALDLRGPAVETLARDLDSSTLREGLAAGLRSLPTAAIRPHVAEATAALLADDDLTLRAFACALLAEELEPGA